jgi:hypothetical protein
VFRNDTSSGLAKDITHKENPQNFPRLTA